MSRAQAELALVAILEAEQFLAVEIPPAGFSPQFRRRGNGHKEFLGSSTIHFLTNDLFDLSNDPEAEREIRVDTGRHLANQTGSKHELMADGFRFTRVFSQSRD